MSQMSIEGWLWLPLKNLREGACCMLERQAKSYSFCRMKEITYQSAAIHGPRSQYLKQTATYEEAQAKAAIAALRKRQSSAHISNRPPSRAKKVPQFFCW